MAGKFKRSLSMCGALCLAAVLSSCGQPEDVEEDAARWSMSFRWSVDGEVDLDHPDIAGVRAEIESITIGAFLGLKYGYPGWSGTSLSIPDGVDADRIGDGPGHEGTGTAYLHLSVQADTADEKFVAVCRDMTGTAKVVDGRYERPHPAGPEESPNSAFTSEVDVFLVRVEPVQTSGPWQGSRNAPPDAGRTPDGPSIPGPDGRAPRPSDNVFDRPILPGNTLYQSTYDDVMKDLCTPWIESRQDGPSRAEAEADDNQPPAIKPYFPGWPES